jgi:hypothetical protein
MRSLRRRHPMPLHLYCRAGRISITAPTIGSATPTTILNSLHSSNFYPGQEDNPFMSQKHTTSLKWGGNITILLAIVTTVPTTQTKTKTRIPRTTIPFPLPLFPIGTVPISLRCTPPTLLLPNTSPRCTGECPGVITPSAISCRTS